MGDMSIGRAISWLADASPDAIAVRCGDDALTRRELDLATNRIARRWMVGGVEVDDLVAIALPSSLDLVLATVASWKAGATPMTLSPALPRDERAALLTAAGPGWLVDREVLVDDDTSDAPLPELAASSWKAPTSSGSTGRPKIVRSTAPARVDPTRPVTEFVPFDAVQLVAGPLFHAAPFVYAMRGLMTGHELVVMPQFDAAEWLSLVATHRATWGMLAPAMMHQISRVPDRASYDVSSLASVLHVGARCPEWLKRDWIDWLGPERVVELYAGTEAQGLSLIDGHDWLEHPGSVGRPVGGSEFRVLRPDGSQCEPDEVGEIWMRREHPTYTYVGAEHRDDPSGGHRGEHGDDRPWHTLGDSGRIDADGYLYVGDRLHDVIVTSRVRVDPADVEAVLDEHPEVASSVVVGRPDEASGPGEQVHAVVQSTAAVADLEAWVADRLEADLRPRSWQVVDVPLRDSAGKVRRSDWRTPEVDVT